MFLPALCNQHQARSFVVSSQPSIRELEEAFWIPGAIGDDVRGTLWIQVLHATNGRVVAVFRIVSFVFEFDFTVNMMVVLLVIA